MRFRTSPANRPTRVVAALVLLAFGTTMVVGLQMPLALPGVAVIVVSVWVLGNEAFRWRKEAGARRDPYDLSALAEMDHYQGPSRDNPDAAPDAPSWEAEEGDDILCYRCNMSLPSSLSICPGCGAILH